MFNAQACVLMNNIQQTRIQLEKTYQSMGGQQLEEDAASVLTKLQSTLNGVLDQLAQVFAERCVGWLCLPPLYQVPFVSFLVVFAVPILLHKKGFMV